MVYFFVFKVNKILTLLRENEDVNRDFDWGDMNSFTKTLATVPVSISTLYCTEITFPGFDSNGNDKFTYVCRKRGGGNTV